ncbi:MAG: lipase maturation factor family protein [Chthoniobacteraceae bacterium]
MNESFAISRRAFAHAFGAIFAIVFISFAVQARGLIGAQGIEPAADFLKAVQQSIGVAGWQVPTIFWLNPSDTALLAVCWLGVVASLVLASGFAPGPAALVCWALYLSLCSVGSVFLSFQWDTLILESALLAAIALPWRLRSDWSHEPPLQRVGRWLLWWLVFRLNFESGVVKLTWGDKTWLELRALAVHFETQCIPNPFAWYAHQMPAWLSRASCALMFAVELVIPFLIAFPHRIRHGAALALIALQLGIIATGNFAYFNWLTIALCLPLFADSFFPARWRREHAAHSAPQWKWVTAGCVGLFVFVATLPGLLNAFRSDAADLIARALMPLRSFNGYGLFRVMTTERPEIIVEGSRDGVNWDAYEFRYKAGDVYRRPPFVAPHQPRLDWQMWFAALADVRQTPWFVNFLTRLLQGSPDVLALLEKNPFPGEPPRYVRAVLYDYRFTHWSDDTVAWWKREQKALYCPPISLKTTPP